MSNHRGGSSPQPSFSRTFVILAALSLLVFSGTANAGTITRSYDFEAPIVQSMDGFHRISMEGAQNFGAPGEPILPMAGVQLLLPPGEVITKIEVIPGAWVALSGSYTIEPGQRQYPLAFTGPYQRDLPNNDIYSSSSSFPERLHDAPYVGLYRGYRIATFAIHPVKYIPADGSLSYIPSCEVVITTAPDADAWADTERMIRHDPATLARLQSLVDNPLDASAYESITRFFSGGRNLDPSLAYKYIIITTESWDEYLDPLVNFETQRGHKAGVFLKSWILGNYNTGVDDQDDIRDFIIDAYATWDVDYVLLVGDARETAGIPHRGLYAVGYGTPDTDIPADMYYSCLDGTWNNDGDGYWGESGEDDLYPELGIGRACVDSQTEIENFITKVIRYQAEPVVAECDEALMVGELLWDDPTWGGDYKDEIKNGASTHGYTTVGFPPSINVGTLYDKNGTWSSSQLITLMESGMNIVNHLGHCNVQYALKMTNTDIPSFDNDGVNHSYNFVYSQGCYCGAFDNRDPDGYYIGDCYAEQFQTDDDGAAAIIMNSRYGWGQHSSTDGSSQYFDRQFFDAIFGEQIYPLADANDDSKMDNVWSINYGANRWCCYELNVFGDPAMHLWTAEPGQLDASYTPVVYIGQGDMDVTVTALGGGAISGARVTIYTADYSVYDTGVTNTFGTVTLHPNAEAPADLYVKATAHNRLDFNGTASIIPPAGPYLVFAGNSIEDAGGDDDGAMDAGETVGLNVLLENVGIDPTTGVTAELTSVDTNIQILTPTQAYPDIPVGGSEMCNSPYLITIAGNAEDGHIVPFALAATSNEGQWDAAFNLSIQAPVLCASNYLLTDAAPNGNEDGGIDPGETVALMFSVLNTGHSAAAGLTGLLSCGSADVVIHDAAGECDEVPINGAGLFDTYEVEFLGSCPSPGVLVFLLQITNAYGLDTTIEFDLDVGPWFDDAETDRGWTMGAAGDNATSGYWTRVDPIGTVYETSIVQPEDDHTPSGTMCFVTANGSVGGAAGEADVDGGITTLLTPVFDLSGATSATLSYWRWYTNDLGNNPGEDYWTVDITADGDTWVHLEYTQESANTWTQFTFNLGDYVDFTSQTQIRFIAADASPGSLVEAAVDDFSLDIVRGDVSGAPAVADHLEFGIVSCSPNPFNPQTSIAFRLEQKSPVRLSIFDVSGRRVRSLVHGPVAAGNHMVVFDGTDSRGHAVSSGIYFLKLETPNIVQVKRLTLIR
ncbi:MAG: T9SS type A sorting domain-containing protein [Candidatus Eisenbacteria bacterium]|uniref:T9SS type A sorting domain-containing protein n=1 Tax=Eiseniibacteriota bacterium TaxID=2212470 RepID=A0A948W8G2_UNCEI|nr:T9SS type A sorting domain-containing protein [Candidatus Eisenbacteria bacterium]MBU1949850.1 T9SS type A sorting domain-containing protein [Candidatus Eisenbacteria bacterium]MBU2693295.1 T9SS type A sorting domain-containing protein [Candidatus Eisenbacteria bacterium]